MDHLQSISTPNLLTYYTELLSQPTRDKRIVRHMWRKVRAELLRRTTPQEIVHASELFDS